MKLPIHFNRLLVALTFLASGPLFAASELDGKTFCRTVDNGGMFGQPKGPRQLCMQFENGVMIDGANTSFGRPPEAFPYSLVELENDAYVVVLSAAGIYRVEFKYTQEAIVSDLGAVFKIKE